MEVQGLFIDNETVPAQSGKSFARINPVTGAVASRAAAAGVADAIAAADAAGRAFPQWAETPPAKRRAVLLAAASGLEAEADRFVTLMREEIGATEGWARFNVSLAAEMLREAAGLATAMGGEVIPSNRAGSLAMAVRQPAGVVLAIAPWNAPVILGVRALAAPLACGNSVVMKLSETCPLTQGLIVKVLIAAGLPKGVLNAISHAPDAAEGIVEALIAHNAVRRVNFTGSTRVGRIIGALAGRHLKPALLELGGKAPLVVLDDADLDAAVSAIAFGAFLNQGQICMSTERVVVDEKIADALVKKLVAKAKTLKAIDPATGPGPLGALVGKSAADRIAALVEDARQQGARILTGGTISGVLMDATVIDGVTPKMKVYGEESFGPLVTIVRAADTEDAIRIANDTEYGLAAAVFGRDSARALGVARRIQSGICHVNGPTVHDEAQMPFGGVKASGFGRFGGRFGIAEFTDLRWITLQERPIHYPF
ncbi:aldehyde dehydrogenase [Arsenicitalea aurantiaca]|uniref:Aldehyde dehydrogenase n=1 Tax=Arsenicitalea aurantiaca TaxID=1783274 RepID=A0A433X438_9HYPH|nr:aldehyde dehydrogenase [Arsenicitalea aurantiaca]RUT28829.1 aldehyde dehydrogenase [Arsenicitalea aurantiaca]